MKCKYCNGTGEHVNDANRMTTCEFCGGTGVIKPLTNEEWLRQASTEEKALFLARLYGHSRKINLPELLFRNVGTREVTDVAEYIGKWLKEKHNA